MPSPHPVIFDRSLLHRRRARALALGPSTFLIERVAEELADRLATVLRQFEVAVDLGTPTAALRRVLAESGKVGTIIAVDALAVTEIEAQPLPGHGPAPSPTEPGPARVPHQTAQVGQAPLAMGEGWGG